jgi:hypothetical protein
MNKYLSFERSKKLAELGYKPERLAELRYKPESGTGWWCANRVNDFVPINIRFYKDPWIYQEEDKTREWYPAPDCHDLLMELQKYNSGLKRFTLTGRLLEDTWKVTCIDYKKAEIDQCCDSNPVEALGEALIKILETEQ